MEKSVLDIICASLDTFFESERKIGTYIIQHTAKVVDMTVGELAQACGVSDASVSRFCKKIDMKGFHHLKITLAKEISERGKEEEEVSNHISVNDIGQSLKNILANKVTEITQTVSMMDTKQLHKILDKFKKGESEGVIKNFILGIVKQLTENIENGELVIVLGDVSSNYSVVEYFYRQLKEELSNSKIIAILGNN